MKVPAACLDVLGRWVPATVARVAGEVTQVTASAYGSVARVQVAEGDLVHRQQLLVELEHRELDHDVNLAAVELARVLGAPAATGGPAYAQASGAPSRAEHPDPGLVQVRYSLAQLRRSQADVRAAVAGRVLDLHVGPGDFVAPGQPVVSILASDESWVLARFDPVDFARLRIGQAASVAVASRFVEARVAGLSSPDEPALIELIGHLRGVRPGMTASVSVAVE